MMRHGVHRGAQRGLSLIELMLALVIGLVLIGSMVTVFSGSKRSSTVNTALTELQESARFALDSIVRDIRLAGFQGCADGAAATVRATNAPTTDFHASALTASRIESDGSWTPAPPTGFTPPAQGQPGAPVPGTHALSIQFGSPETWRIDRMLDKFAPVVLADGVLAADIGIIDGDVALVSDCQRADIFTVSGVSGSSIAHDGAVNRFDGANDGRLQAAYGEPAGSDRMRARIMRFEANLYYIGDTGRTNGAGDPLHSLYRLGLPYVSPPPASTPRAAIEMVEGVGNLQVLLGMDEPSFAGHRAYVRPGEAGPPGGTVQQVELGLLMQSFDPVTDRIDTRSYSLAGRSLAPGSQTDETTYRTDRRMRIAFNSSIDIRNR